MSPGRHKTIHSRWCRVHQTDAPPGKRQESIHKYVFVVSLGVYDENAPPVSRPRSFANCSGYVCHRSELVGVERTRPSGFRSFVLGERVVDSHRKKKAEPQSVGATKSFASDDNVSKVDFENALFVDHIFHIMRHR